MNDTVVKLTKDKLYDKYVEELGPECLIFVSEEGKESVTTLDSKFFFIPGNGVKGQVLKKSDAGFFWDDFNSVRNHTGIGNVPIDYSTVVIRTGTNNSAQEESEIVFLGTFVKGQQVTLYITKSPEYEYGYRITLDRDKYVNLNNIYSVDVTEGVWSKLVFFYDGTDMYVDIQSEVVITRGSETLSMVSNGTNVVKNQYELSTGKYNKSTRQTSNSFGVKNSILTVGNGLDDENRHDAFVVLQDGTIQVPLTLDNAEQSYEFDNSQSYYEKPMVCLQNWVNDKMDKPENEGSVGQVLTKTEGGSKWVPMNTENGLFSRTVNGESVYTVSSVGIGTSETDRKNAFEVMQNGDVYVYGIGGYDGTNAATEGVQTLQEVINNIPKMVGNYVQSITQNGGYIKYTTTNFRTGNSDDHTIDFKTINGGTIFGQGDISV